MEILKSTLGILKQNSVKYSRPRTIRGEHGAQAGCRRGGGGVGHIRDERSYYHFQPRGLSIDPFPEPILVK